MASLSERRLVGLPVPVPAARFLGVVAVAPIALGIARLLPAEGAGLGLRLAAAAACVLLLPGALVLRALEWPARLGVAIAGAFAWSLVVVFVALALTFTAAGSLSLTVAGLGIISGGALLPALRAAPARPSRGDVAVVAAIAVAGLAMGGVVWWASTVVHGDALFHLARVRKLDELPVLYSVNVVDEFRDGGLHPGYAYPLWHGVLAVIARLADVDSSLVVLHLASLLAPLALIIVYGAGAELFGSLAGGVATAAATAALVGFARDGIGSFDLVALPATASRLLILPALLALTFAYVRDGGWVRVATVAAAGLGLAVVHPTYALFAALPLAGFLVARPILSGRGRRDVPRIAVALVALLVPAGIFLAWLWPVIADTAGFRPSATEKARGIALYAAQLDVFGGSFRLSPDAIVRGSAAIAALVAIPAAVLAARRRWAAFVVGGSLAVLVVLLAPPFFTRLADLSSLSQARRLALFLPLPFALAGGAALLGRMRLPGCAVAGAAGVALAVAYPDWQGGRLAEGRGGWSVWVAVAGGGLALVAGRVLARRLPRADRFAILAAIAFVLPLAVVGLAHTERDRPDGRALTPGLLDALRADVPARATVFADLETSYRIAAAAPVLIAVGPPAHVANTAANRPYERRADAIRFFYRDDVSYLQKAQILSTYGASWLVVDRTRKVPRYVSLLPPPVYEDGRFALYRLRRT